MEISGVNEIAAGALAKAARERVLNLGSTLLIEGIYRPNQRIKAHRHALAHCTYVLDGSYSETRLGRQCVHQPGELLFHTDEDVHSNVIGLDGAHCLNIEFGTADPLPVALCATRDIAAGYRCKLSDDVATTLLQKLETNPVTSAEQACCASLDGKILRSAKDFRDLVFRHLWQIIFDRSPEWLTRCVNHLNSQIASPFRVSDLSTLAGVHPNHLARVFRSRLGQTAGEYVRRKRVALSCDLLLGSRSSLAATAVDCGFFDQAHFTREFRRLAGSTPGQYRERNRATLAEG